VKILIADDSDVMRKIIATYLAELGQRDVDHACDGAEALAKAKTGSYGLILLDWNMPKFTGIDVLRRLRGDGIQTPVAMVTTEVNKQAVLEAIKAGAQSYIMKPFQKDVFVSRIRQLLGQTR
jgi:two-component system chemotaxis response regulator CheY